MTFQSAASQPISRTFLARGSVILSPLEDCLNKGPPVYYSLVKLPLHYLRHSGIP